jgi:alcohol dehydrogenase class IV
MLVASSMGATAFQKGLGGMHAISHTLGALYGAHHGLLNAILMPYILVANREAIDDKIVRLANYLELDNPGFDVFLNWVLEMRSTLDIPHALSAIGIDESEASKVGEMSALDPTGAGNPIELDGEEYATIFVKAVRGEL